ncbi:hypothetical protein AB0O34_28200 [Sphaerisporangium sp. NPDC088356]|uniref:hypothetical protein n=1 Tax=Sphaerisporangium sp. NPDC088356 TaxID=3154871 RepID=UPI00341C9A77
MLVVLTMRRLKGEPSGEPPLDGERMLALLPRQWRKDFREGAGYIAIRIHTDENITSAQIREQVVAILSNPEVTRWRLVSCETLTHHEIERRGNPATLTRHTTQRAQWN